jgi:hypothetical protein
MEMLLYRMAAIWNLEWDRRDRILLMTIHLSFLLLFASTNPLGFSDENIVITY